MNNKKLILLEIQDEEEEAKLREIKLFCTRARLNFTEGTVLYKTIDDFEEFISQVLQGKAFYSDGTIYDVGTHCNQPFKTED